MAITIRPPQPGDLITSNFMKQLIDQITLLDARIAALEGVTPGAGGKVAIARIVPTDVVPGDLIQIIGVNFGLPSENVVTFDGSHTVIPTSGDDRQLSLIVPTIDLGTASSRSVTVTVSGGARGSDSTSLRVHAIQATIPAGTVTISPGTIPANIAPDGKSYVFPFTITAVTNLDESYTLTPKVPPVPAGQAAWTAIVTSDAAGDQPLREPLFIPKPVEGGGASKARVYVKVTIPLQTQVTSPYVELGVTSVHNPPPNPGSPSATRQVPFQFDAPSQPPQTIGFAISSFTGSGVAGDLTTVVLSQPIPTSPPIDGINYKFQNLKAGQYTLSLEWQDKTDNNRGWTASFGGAPGLPAWPQTKKTITMSSAGDFGPEKIAIVGIAGAPPNTLIVSVRAVGENSQTDYGILNQGIKAA